MIIRQFVSAKQHWLLFFFSFLMFVHIPVRVYGVDIVPAGTYVTFSTVYNGKRYYLGVDTVKVNSGTDTVVAAFDKPNYATMWTLGEERGAGAGDYLRTIKNVWLKERKNKNKFLSVQDASTYGLLVIADTAQATLWTTANDERVQSKYTQGFLYHYAEKNGLEVYRYLTYDPLYGFSRLYSTRPSVSQRMSVWDRKTGNDVTCTMTPPTYTFGLNTTQDIVRRHITSRVYYYRNVDRFRSRYDQTDVIVRSPEVYYNQEGLLGAPYYMFGYYEWASNPRPSLPSTPAELLAQSYDGKAKMPFYTDSINHHNSANENDWTIDHYWMDSTVLWVSDTKYSRDDEENLWHDTVFAIGKSPFDVLRKPAGGGAPTEGDYVNHGDWLRQHYWIKNGSGKYEHFVDSILVVRQTFHAEHVTTLTVNSSPGDHVFPYFHNDTVRDGTAVGVRNTQLFTITGTYRVDNNTLYADGGLASTKLGDIATLDIRNAEGSEVEEVLYDSLDVVAYEAGTTTTCSWLTVDINPSRKDQIRVVCANYDPDAQNNRVAEIHYTYRYSDGNVASTRVIYVTQRSKTVEAAGASAEIYAFNHKGNIVNGLQGTAEQTDIIYAIPEDNLSLPLHRDYWGYYRWFIYEGDYKDKDLENNGTWTYARKPYNYRNQDFMPINSTTDPASRGCWDVIRDIHSGNDNFEPAAEKEHFVVGSATGLPSVKYPGATGDSKSGKIACDVSAYYDITTATTEGTPYVKKNLTSLTEPTLSYRQIFDVRPAKGRADELKTCLYKGDGGDKNVNWLEEKVVVVPTNNVFSLIPDYPVRKGDARFKDENLGYVYYANPSASKEGTDEGFASVDYKKSYSYNRIGNHKDVGDRYTLTPITAATMLKLKEDKVSGYYDSLLFVNPYSGECVLIGNDGGQIPARRSLGAFSSESALRDSLTARIDRGEILLSTYLLDIGHYYYDPWIGSTEDYYYFYHEGEGKFLRNLYTGIGSGLSYHSLKWYNNGIGNNEMQVAAYAGSGANLPTGMSTYLMTFYATYYNNTGFIKAENWSPWSSLDIYPIYPNDVAAVSTTAKHAWIVYRVARTTPGSTHEEHPLWEKYNTSTFKWDSVAWVGGGKGDYTMLEGGELRVPKTAHTKANDTILYRLRTENFQLAKFVVATRNDTVYGPSTSALISEDSIQNHFDILYTLGNEYFPAPPSADVTAFYHQLPLGWTEMSYHYPVGTGEGEIAADRRVYTSDLPAAGEYAYLNKFTLDDHTTEATAGAGNGYMLCIHAAPKPMTIFNFTYPKLPCSDQDIYLTFDICDPLDNAYNPQVTADLEGKVGEGEWERLYRFKTGGVLYKGENTWQQVVIPIPYTTIAAQDSFRCVAQLTGSTDPNAYVLLDRIRFIAKERPVSVFQHKGACLASEGGGKVDIIARVDYQHASYPAGTHIAFQYQKKEGRSYRSLLTAAEAEAAGTTKEMEAYVNDFSVTSTDVVGKSCGVITIPAAEFEPNPADTVSIAKVTTKNRCYVNEGTKLNPYYVMYLSQQVDAVVGDTFRVVMDVVPDKETPPNFATAGCSTERIISIDNPIVLQVSGYDGVWPNHTREDLVGGSDALSLRTPNETYSVTAAIGDGFLPAHYVPGSGKCMFDVVRTVERERGMTGNDAWFKNRFGCSRSQFRELMMIFRKDVTENTMRLETNWNNVRPEDFMYDGRSKAQADTIYTILNRLIVDSAFIEIGVSSYDIYLGDNNNAYAVFWPIPASGTYIYDDSKVRETRSIPVCSTPRWFEIHADDADYSLRFGYDNMWAGDYYLIPVIRASRTDANSEIKVRLAEMTNDGSKVSVMKWDATTIVETNEPSWSGSGCIYNPDKNAIGQDLNDYAYYYAARTAGKADTIVTFSPKADNTYSLKAGYWYKFRTPYYRVTVSEGDFAEPVAAPTDYTEFIVAVAPDTVVWTPSHEGKANYWNDDNNWTPQMASMPADGFKATVPMSNTKVIIPKVEEGLLPIVSDLVMERKDALDFGYEKNTCSKILFKPQSQMLGQEKLNYDTAYVDVLLRTGSWQTFTPALEHIYSGDMYIPFDAVSYVPADPKTGASVDTVDFAPKPFPYTTSVPALGYNPREYPFIVYQGFYNSSVHVAFYNTDKDGDPVDSTVHASKSVVDWVKTNAMDLPYVPGKACVLKGFDAWDDYSHEMVIRLPKQETSYYGYGKKNGELTVGAAVAIDRGVLTHNLAYDKYATGFSSENGLSYTLTNEVESNIFFFGNPTMSLIDVYQLCLDNADELQLDGAGKHQFTAYQLKEGSTYMPQQVTDYGQYFVAP